MPSFARHAFLLLACLARHAAADDEFAFWDACASGDVATLDAAMAKACASSQQRELVLAAGEVLKNSGATVLMGASPADTASMLAGSAGAEAVRMQQRAVAQGAQAA